MSLIRFGAIGSTRNIWLDSYLLVVLASGVLGYLSVRGWTNITLFLLLIPALLGLKTACLEVKESGALGPMRPIFITLAMPIAAVLVSQALRQEWIARAYDGPSRILLSIPLFIYFTYKKIDFAELLSLCAPLALLILVPLVHLHPEVLAHWGGRFATVFVDPNAFGTYALVLTAFCFFSLETFAISSAKQVLQVAGLLAGIYLIAGSGTRGSWIAIPPLLLLWIILKGKTINPRPMLILCVAALILTSLVLINYLHTSFLERLYGGFREISSWLNNSNSDTAAGLRLTMWQMAWELFKHSPFHGYGDAGFRNYLNEPWIASISSPLSRETILNNGPHNEFLANLLRSGFLGGISVLCLFLLPLRLFWQSRHGTQTKLASHLGLAFMVCLMFCSLSIEVLTLKYTNTFYGLAIAGLAAQAIRAKAKRHEEIYNHSH